MTTIATGNLVAAAAALAGLAAEQADAADRDRRLSTELLDALLAAGFARHFVSTRHGGAEGTFTDLAQALMTVGAGCASAAWVGLIYASSSRMAGFLPEEGCRDVWAAGPDTPVASALRPAGRAVRDGDHWVIGGRWEFLSGIGRAEWALLCVAGDDGTRYFAVPRTDWTVEATWLATGMRATASDTVVVTEAQVPATRSFAHQVLLTGTTDAAACHRVPLAGCGPQLFAAAAIGPAAAALDRWAATRAKKDTVARLALARSAAELDVARLLVVRAATTADRITLTPAETATTMRDSAVAARMTRDATDRLIELSGSAMLSERDPLQRAWRDVRTATAHGALSLDAASVPYARDVWGWRE